MFFQRLHFIALRLSLATLTFASNVLDTFRSAIFDTLILRVFVYDCSVPVCGAIDISVLALISLGA